MRLPANFAYRPFVFAKIQIAYINIMRFTDRIKNILFRYPLSLITVSVIVYLSLFKPSDKPLYTISHIDKVAHFFMYAGFCTVLWFEYLLTHKVYSYKKIVIGAIICPILFSGALEIAQTCFTKYRTGDWLDFLYNALGVISACVFSIYVLKPFIKRHNLYKYKA